MRSLHSWTRRAVAVTTFGALVFAAGKRVPAQAPATVWLEGESATSETLKPVVEASARPEFLSGGQWLRVSVDAGDVAKTVPAEGALLRIPFTVESAGNYHVWGRIGFEFARSPFEWRVDDGEWAAISPDALTTDLVALSFWTEVAWLEFGARDLKAGPHRLELRLKASTDEKGAVKNIVFAADAFALTTGAFRPHGKWKPGEAWRTPRDEEAARQVFEPATPAAAGDRVTLPLKGLWEVARDDEQAPGDVAQPLPAPPADAFRSGVPIPSDKNISRPDLLFAHRLWLYTKVNVPTALSGRSFFLTFPQNSLNTTVYVNGVYCGFNNAPFAHFDVDVTKAVKPGLNEIQVGIRDAWYGHTANPDNPLKLRKTFNLPIETFHNGFQDFDYPVWNSPQSGILTTPTFTVAGAPAYIADVFAKPSVATKRMVADVTLVNPTKEEVTGEIAWSAVNDAGAVEKTFAPQPFTVKANAQATVTLADGWSDPKLWWPDAPAMHRLRTVLRVNGQPADTTETPFGFREWGVRGTDFTLNGVTWRIWGDLTTGATPEEWLKNYRQAFQRTMRLATAGQGGDSSGWMGMSPDEALAFFDRNGVTVRRNGPLDGEAIGYAFSESDPDLKKRYGTEMKKKLMENWAEQMVAQVKGERNHPSIQIWTFDNEFAFINLINLLGDSPLMDEYEREMTKAAQAVMAADPTRMVMSDGGGATKFQTLPVHGNHYVFSPNDSRYPGLAYEKYPEGGGRGRWVWDQKRPRFIGEDYFASGINPADYAQWGGEAAFQGKAQTRDAATLLYRMLTEGYRWAGQSAWQFWVGRDYWSPADLAQNPYFASNAPRAVFVRQWDWTFGSGQIVPRTWGIFNDTQHPEPLAFTRRLLVNGKAVWARTTTHTVPPGESVRLEESLPMPMVKARQEAQLVLSLSAEGKEVFRDVKAVSLLPDPFATASPAARPAPIGMKPAPRRARRGGASPGLTRDGGSSRTPQRVARLSLASALPVAVSVAAASRPLVYDPQGKLAAFLRSRNVPFTLQKSLSDLPAGSKLLLVGPDALTPEESASSRLAAWASEGHSVVVLDQTNPLRYQGLPAEMTPVTGGVKNDFGQQVPVGQGSVAFIEDATHPVFRGLAQKDFFTWGPDGLLFRNAYSKPTRGGKSLLQCGPRLVNTAVAEIPAGRGLLLVSQVLLGEKLSTSAVARRLLANMIEYAQGYRQVFRSVVVAAGDDPSLLKALDATGLRYIPAADPLQAMAQPGAGLVIASATPAHLAALAAHKAQVAAFNKRGGYLVLHGLTPDGLASYNALVGVNHLIRPFRRERVTFPPVRDPLASGLTLGDVVMLSGERIFDWTADEFVADDVFSWVVDTGDLAPFGTWNNDFYLNLVNGMTNADAWKYIVNDTSHDYILTLPRPSALGGFTWVGDTNYNTTSKVELIFDGNEATKLTFPVAPNGESQTFDITPPRTAKVVDIRHAEFTDLPGKNHTLGADNVSLWAAPGPKTAPPVKPLLNVGGLVRYPRGDGGILLVNLFFKENEAVPANAGKKRTILATLLRNLDAPFGGKTVIAGANLTYTPVDLSKEANQYRNERGWFGDPKLTFADLPTGRQTFAGVPFDIFEFATSPTPTAVMLGGAGIPNSLPDAAKPIPVNRKADALFFLQAARIDQRRTEREVKENKPGELARYVVTYADGKTEVLPILAEVDVEEYHQTGVPKAIPGAQVAWSKPYAGTDQVAVAYLKQWNNPRPEVPIATVTLEYGPERRGVPALLALTAAEGK